MFINQNKNINFVSRKSKVINMEIKSIAKIKNN